MAGTSLGVFFFVAVAIAGCGTRPNPDFCNGNAECNNGLVCEGNRCVIPIDADLSCSTDDQCTGTTPVCDDRACRACSLDDECASGVCRADGSCEDPNNILYAAPNGVAAGECAAGTPCDLAYARTKLSTAKSTIRLSAGTYSLSGDFIVSSNTATVSIVGGPSAVVQRSSPGAVFAVSGAALTLRGFTLNRGVSCINGGLDIVRTLFSTGTEVRPWVQSDNCMLNVLQSELNDSKAEGIIAQSGSFLLERSRVQRSMLAGLSLPSGTHTIVSSFIHENQGIGIASTAQKLVVRRSSVAANRMGGISGQSGTHEITNNFIYRNGNSANSQFGGVRLINSSSVNRIEHNTIAHNDSDVNANPQYAGGIYCVGTGGPNNIVYNNFAGNNTLPNAQVNASCDMTGSLVLNGDGTNQLHFVSPIAVPFDYHLADSTSPAANSGLAGSITEDFDGEPRPNGIPDVGADELQ